MKRAKPSGVKLTHADAAIIKGMLARGDRQHDIAAWFGVNSGRIGEIASGQYFSGVLPTGKENLPPPGPYLNGRDTYVAIQALNEVTIALEKANSLLRV